MKNQSIVTRNEGHVIGVLSGWDRLALRGCFRLLEYVDGMIFLYRLGVLLKSTGSGASGSSASAPRRRAEVSGQVNQRYSEALGSLDTTTEVAGRGVEAQPVDRLVLPLRARSKST